jgi:site-specific DNA recombinase
MAPRRNGIGSAAVAVQTAVRCAVYCRKSTTEGQDSTFNSLDNQQQSAEAYIASQRHQGWAVHSDRYHDYGFSGGNTDRPALQRLLADAKSGAIDTIVVYRLDRLSRSLIDFLHIHEDLEKWDVGLVSVTEHLNTTTPHGRMMVNVLLSFAQYERELIGERTRDKIHGARRLGRWTGGMPPLGYDLAPEGGRLIENKVEAATVVSIFELYLEHSCLLGVVQELRRRGIRRKTWTTRFGKTRVGREWNVVDTQRLLREPLYAGMQKLGDQTFKGEHPAIVSKKLFDQVQRMLDSNRRAGTSRRNRHGALLRGLLRCAACDTAMSHAFTERRGKAFRYYRCTTSIKHGAAACPTGSVPALKIEAAVVDQIRRIGSDPALCAETFLQVEVQVEAERRGLKNEAKRVERERTAARAEIGELTTALVRATGAAADAVMAKLAEVQERVVGLEQRQREIADRRLGLADQHVDPEAVQRALAQFTDVWDVLLSPERERVIHVLIDRVDFDGETEEISIAFSATGANLIVTQVSP